MKWKCKSRIFNRQLAVIHRKRRFLLLFDAYYRVRKYQGLSQRSMRNKPLQVPENHRGHDKSPFPSMKCCATCAAPTYYGVGRWLNTKTSLETYISFNQAPGSIHLNSVFHLVPEFVWGHSGPSSRGVNIYDRHMTILPLAFCERRLIAHQIFSKNVPTSQPRMAGVPWTLISGTQSSQWVTKKSNIIRGTSYRNVFCFYPYENRIGWLSQFFEIALVVDFYTAPCESNSKK